MNPEHLEFVGVDKKGFQFYKNNEDHYIYMKYPDRDYFVGDINRKNEIAGWFCSSPCWEVMQSVLVNGNAEGGNDSVNT